MTLSVGYNFNLKLKLFWNTDYLPIVFIEYQILFLLIKTDKYMLNILVNDSVKYLDYIYYSLRRGKEEKHQTTEIELS